MTRVCYLYLLIYKDKQLVPFILMGITYKLEYRMHWCDQSALQSDRQSLT